MHYIKMKQPIDWSGTFNLEGSCKGVKVQIDDDGYVIGLPVFLSDGFGQDSSGKQVVTAVEPTATGIPIQAVLRVGSGFEAQRTPTTFKNQSCTTAANTAVWTPATGKKFRVLGLMVVVPIGTAAAAAEFVNLKDSATGFLTVSISGIALAATSVPFIYIINLPGNGYLSSAVNNVLNAALNADVTAGNVEVSVWGTEE